MVHQEYLAMLSAIEMQQHLRDYLFHGLHKQLHTSMDYLYDDMRVMYPQLMTTAQKAESEQEDQPGEEKCVRSTQAEGKDDSMILSEWQYRSYRILQSVTLNSEEVKEMVMASNVILGVKVKIKSMARDMTIRG